MTASLNKAQILGRLGADPERREFQHGGGVVNFTVATTEYWKSASGERKSATEWHRVTILNEALGKTAMSFLRKGSTVYVEGQMRSRTYTDRQNVERRVTELVVPKYGGDLKLMDPRQDDAARGQGSGKDLAVGADSGPPLDDEVPF